MDSLNSDMKPKASVKHLEFQLQRERTLTNDLQARCKTFQAQIAQLEQDKAELRREKLTIGEEAKRMSKLDERVHALQKEIESRDAIIAAERSRVQEAKAETEEVRFNAKTSIASWTAAEEQWLAEQSALNEAVLRLRDECQSLRKECDASRATHDDLSRQLATEKDRDVKLRNALDEREAELQLLRSQMEKLQGKCFELEQTVYKLDKAGDTLKEALDLKDTEIRTLEAQITKFRDTEDKMEATICTLNDRLNAAKMVNMEGKGEIEKLMCDLADARKENHRLVLQADSLRRDQEYALQSQSSGQQALADLREKYHQLQSDLKEKNGEVRKHELTISQLNVDLKRLESQSSEWSFRCASLETQVAEGKEEIRKCQAASDDLLQTKTSLQEEVKQLQAKLEAQEEEMTLIQAHLDDRVEHLQHDVQSLESENRDRQQMIDDLTAQLGTTNEKNAYYHHKILQESEYAARMRQETERLQRRVALQELSLLESQCMVEKQEMGVLYQMDVVGELSCMCAQLQESNTALHREKDNYVKLLEEAKESLALQTESINVLTKEHAVLTLKEEELQRVISVKEEEAEQLRIEIEAAAANSDKLQSMNVRLEEELRRYSCEMATQCNATADAAATHVQDSKLWMLFTDNFMRFVGENVEALAFAYAAKTSVALEACERCVVDASQRVSELTLAQEKLFEERQELSAVARETREVAKEQTRAAVQQCEAQTTKLVALEGKLIAAQKEKEQARTQLMALLQRCEAAEKAFEAQRRDSQETLEREQSRRTVAETEVAKLRDGLAYEIKRKCEYKSAISELRKLREEGERCRVQEKQMASLAIEKANTETKYWIQSFDKLKGLVEASRRTGKMVDPVDAHAVYRLQKVMAKNAAPLQSYDVNAPETENSNGKRQRVEHS